MPGFSAGGARVSVSPARSFSTPKTTTSKSFTSTPKSTYKSDHHSSNLPLWVAVFGDDNDDVETVTETKQQDQPRKVDDGDIFSACVLFVVLVTAVALIIHNVTK
jgi:hypothetical protein